jgi:hypothetical protein
MYKEGTSDLDEGNFSGVVKVKARSVWGEGSRNGGSKSNNGQERGRE